MKLNNDIYISLILILLLALAVFGLWELRDIANLNQRVRALESRDLNDLDQRVRVLESK